MMIDKTDIGTNIENIFRFIVKILFPSTEHNFHAGYFSLPDAIIILFFAILVVLIFKKIKLSPVIGYIVAGAIIGPFGLEIVGYNDVTKSLAEFGVVFLLFSIGLELTLERLFAMKKQIFGMGSLQFILTSSLFAGCCYLYNQNLPMALVFGTSIAMSSTAIVLKLLSETYQSSTQAGKISLSILLFQDLAVVPLFILIPLLNDPSVDYSAVAVAIAIKSLVAFAIIILFGRFLLRPLLRIIASAENNDLFIASTLLILLTSAMITGKFGLSLALGAFISGVMIAGTEFQAQAKSIIGPFKSLFLGFFFITQIGMYFDLSLMLQNCFLILLGAAGLIFLKFILMLLIFLAFKVKLPTAINTSLLLSQTGEFAFVLFEMSKKYNFITDSEFQNLSLIVGISMAITPILAVIGRRIENNLSYKPYNAKKIGSSLPSGHNQVLIIGFGSAGQMVAKVLEREGVNFIIIDQNSKVVTKYHKQQKPIYYGDITDLQLLSALEIEHVAAVILTLSDEKTINKAVKLMAKHHPQIPLIVRALDMEHYEHLQAIGVTDAVPEIQEVGLQISKKVLILLGENEDHVKKVVADVRNSEFYYS